MPLRLYDDGGSRRRCRARSLSWTSSRSPKANRRAFRPDSRGHTTARHDGQRRQPETFASGITRFRGNHGLRRTTTVSRGWWWGSRNRNRSPRTVTDRIERVVDRRGDDESTTTYRELVILCDGSWGIGTVVYRTGCPPRGIGDAGSTDTVAVHAANCEAVAVRDGTTALSPVQARSTEA